MKRYMMLVVGILLGCGAATTAPLIAQSYPSNSQAQRWQQFCVPTGEYDDVAPLNEAARVKGRVI